VAAICGCGLQGRAQLRALTRVLPLTECRAFDRDERRAGAFATEMSAELSLRVTVATDARAAVRGADVCVTCTPSRRAFLDRGDVSNGAFLAAVGADNPEKQELTTELMAASTVVVDVLDQCVTMGDLHHALNAGTMSREQVHAELHDVVGGKRPGRRSPGEIVIFDSTGTALEDVAAAAVVYEKAVATGAGLRVHLGG
jgi:ornithine cyclodeaminase/alanine dehydrogenase-like protein (mu-crystallin family)